MATKTEQKLMPHRRVARQLGITTETLRDWVDRGEFPEPHSVFGQTWLYEVELIDQFIKTRRWLPCARFKRGRGRGR